MAEDLRLPSQEYLEQLGREKGNEVLVWYAWRNATRAISVLGSKPLDSVWSESTVKHSYSVIRIVLYLAKLGSQNLQVYFAAAAAYAAYAANTANTANAAAYAAYAAAYAAANAANAAYAAYAAAATAAAARMYIDISNPMIKAAIRDVAYISAQESFKWSTISFYHQKPDQIIKWERSLLENLRELGLDFLADDLEKVWAGKPLEDHAKNYGNKLLDIVMSEPIVLRCAILGFEEPNLEPEKPKPIELSPKIISTSPIVIPEEIKKERRERLLAQLRDFYKQYDHETRVEERTRTKVLIDQVLKELSEL